jgi:hypothetical protein
MVTHYTSPLKTKTTNLPSLFPALGRAQCTNPNKVHKFTYFTYPTRSMNSSSVWMLPLVCEYLTAFSDKDDLFSASTHLSRSPLSRDFLWLFFVAEVWDAGAVWCATPFEIPTSTEDTPPEKISSNYNRPFHHSTESLPSPTTVCSLSGLQTNNLTNPT